MLKNLMLFSIVLLLIYNCSPNKTINQHQEVQIKKEDVIRRTLFGDNWQQMFSQEDSIISFSYHYSNNPNIEFLRIFASKKNNKAIIFRHGYKEQISTINPSIYELKVRNPFTGKIDTAHLFQNDTINLDLVKWKKWKNI